MSRPIGVPDALPSLTRSRLDIFGPDGDRRWHGAVPPLAGIHVGSFVGSPIDVDVEWVLRSGPLGPFAWAQVIRNGIEVERAERTAELRLGVALDYDQLLRLLYCGEPFEAVFDAGTIARSFGTFSCLSGLVHGPGAPRLRTFDRQQLAALRCWATASGAVSGGDAG